MAIYHLNAQIISRSAGKSAVAAAAYRAGEKLTSERLSQDFDYLKKRGVDSSVILAPENAPSWVSDRERLWNEVEKVERLKNSQLAREFNIALPVELGLDAMKNLALGYVREQFVAKGMIADVAFHNLGSHNPHFHVMLTTRHVTERGFGKKNRDWNSRKLLVQQRRAWADCVNTALEEIGRVDQKIDDRTLVAQGIEDRIAQVHLGPDLHRKRAEHIKLGKLREFREKYWLGDLYESIADLNRELASQYRALQEVNESIAVEEKAMGGVTKRVTEHLNIDDEKLSEELEREREGEITATTGATAISERLRGIAEELTSSSAEAEASRRRLQNLTDRLRGDRGEAGGSRNPSQSAGDGTGVKPKKSTGQSGGKTGLPEKDAEVRTGVGDKRDSQQSRKDQQKLFDNLGSGKKRQEADSRGADVAKRNRTVEESRPSFTAGQPADLGVDEALSPELGGALSDKRANSQHRKQTRTHGEIKEGKDSLGATELNSIHEDAIATIREFMEELSQESFEGERYILKIKDDGEEVEMFALDGRGTILQKKGRRISGRLIDEDLEVLKQIKGQLQVHRCMPILFGLLESSGQYQQDNSNRFLAFDEATGVITYRYKRNPSDFLIAKLNDRGEWQYLDGRLTPERESAIVATVMEVGGRFKELAAEQEGERKFEEEIDR